MSEFLAEASVLISPDLATFRTRLLAELQAATRTLPPIEVPVVAAGGRQLAAATAGVTGALDTQRGAAQLLGQEHQRLGASVDRLSAAQRQHAVRMGNVTRGIGTQAAAFAGLRGAVLGANPAFIAGAAAAISFGAAVKSAADLESELNVFAVTTGASADQMARVGEEAQRLGADLSLPGVTAGEAAEAFTQLGKAGLSVEDSLSGARGVLQLATAAQIDNATATQFAASALNAFSLGGEQAVHVADVLTNAANASQGSISDIGIAFQQAAAAARLVGVSFEDTIALLTLLQKNGIRGSDAGTSLRVSFTRLINPTTKARAVLEDLNVQLRDAQGNLRPEAFIEFAQAQENLSKAQQQANAAIVFGTDGLRAYSIISREGLGGLGLVREELDRQGSAAELAGARMAGLTGKMENLKNQLSALGLTLGQLTTGPGGAFLGLLAASVSGVNDLAQGLTGLGREAKSAFDRLNDVASVNIGGVDIGPASGIKVFFETAFAPLPSRIKLIKAMSAGFDESGKNITKARFALLGTVTELNKFGGPGRLKQAISDFKELRAELQNGDEKAQKFAADLDPFIRKLESIPPGQTFDLDIRIPPNILTGEPGEKVGRASAAKFAASLVEELQAQADRINAAFAGVLSGRQGEAGAIEHAAEFGRDVANAFVEATTSALSGRDLAIAQARGDRGAELSILTAQEDRQEAFLNALLRRKPSAKNVALQKEAAQNLDQTRAAITAIQDQAVADAKSDAAETERKADAAREASSKADQKVFDSLVGGQDRIDLAAISARASEGLKDDLALQVLIKNTAAREIAVIDKSVKNVKEKNAAIAARVKILRAAKLEADRLRDEIADAVTEKRRAAADLLTERLGKAITLAGLRENESAELAAINKAIANARNRVKNYKKLGTELIDEKIALEELINQRDALKDDAEEAQRGTSAFDLLSQFTETFKNVGGNLIDRNNPFAGPSGFTNIIEPFLVRQPARPVEQRFPGKVADDHLIGPINQLAEAIRENTAVQRGNRTTGAGAWVGKLSGPLSERFQAAERQRKQLEANNG